MGNAEETAEAVETAPEEGWGPPVEAEDIPTAASVPEDEGDDQAELKEDPRG